MKFTAKLAALLATGSLLVSAAALPACAASAVTEAFLANIRPNVDVLDRSSRLALTNSSDIRIRTFAHSEALEQTIAANALVDWSQSNATRDAVGAPVAPGQIVPDILPGAVSVATLPLAVGSDVLSGRSVAIDVAGPADTGDKPDSLPAGQTELDRLLARHGRPFDVLYRATQADALHQLQNFYARYVQNGDDPDLRAMVLAELPKINKRVAELDRL